MERYPLTISVPRAELTKGGALFRKSYIAYVVEVDDCELPPKVLVGVLDSVFVERRRILLEDYLRALLRLPQVIQDDTIWAFLDSDAATVVVPRFLVRERSFETAALNLAEMERLAAQKTNAFRLCCSAALCALVEVARAEGCTEAQTSLGGQALRARLAGCSSFCAIVRQLLTIDSARRGLVKAGIFGALLSLQLRAAFDAEASVHSSTSLDISPGLKLRKIRDNVAATLKLLLASTDGDALVQFCQHEDWLTHFHKFVVAESTWLHPICASLLWLGLNKKAMSDIIVAGSAKGLQLLGKLITSPDRSARVVASLCLGTVLRLDSVLDSDQRAHCFLAMLALAPDLDTAAEEALDRAAASGLYTINSDSRSPGGAASALSTATACADLDENILALLGEICREDQLHRLELLLAPDSCLGLDNVVDSDPAAHGENSPAAGLATAADSVTAAVVAILDHFSRLRTHEPTVVATLGRLAPQLQRLVIGENLVGDPSDELRARAARVLVRVQGALLRCSEADISEPQALTHFARFANILAVASQDMENQHAWSSSRLEEAMQQRQILDEVVRVGLVVGPPSLGEEKLTDFGVATCELLARRQTLDAALHTSRRKHEVFVVSLEQRKLKQSVLASDIAELEQLVEDLAEEECSGDNLQQSVVEAEARCRHLAAEIESLALQCRDADATAREHHTEARDAEARAAALTKRQAELEDLCHSAPARIERLSVCLAECRQQRVGLVDRGQGLAQDLERTERWLASLREQEREAESALKSLALVRSELDLFRTKLNSELILSDEEVTQLRLLEPKLRPARPTRLEKRSNHSHQDNLTISGCASSFSSNDSAELHLDYGPSPPAWEDSTAAQEFRANPNFRSFVKFLGEREKCWKVESDWLRARVVATEAQSQQLAIERKRHAREEQVERDREDQIMEEMTALDDPTGHSQRYEAAARSASQAVAAARGALSEATKAEGARQLAETRLQQAQTEIQQATNDADLARERALAEVSRAASARMDLEARARTLEVRTRTFLEEWSAVKLDEYRVSLAQAKVVEHLREEALWRRGVRKKIICLVGDLQALDAQLDAKPLENWVVEIAATAC